MSWLKGRNKFYCHDEAALLYVSPTVFHPKMRARLGPDMSLYPVADAVGFEKLLNRFLSSVNLWLTLDDTKLFVVMHYNRAFHPGRYSNSCRIEPAVLAPYVRRSLDWAGEGF